MREFGPLDVRDFPPSVQGLEAQKSPFGEFFPRIEGYPEWRLVKAQ
jgi:hypothetical protein